MDFAALPPEINSARMYAGPGAAPMTAAAAAWNALGAELSTTASSYGSVISMLTDEEWRGSAAAAMAAAAEPFVAWLNNTAAAAEHAASQAMASAAAFETALSMTVPPPAITANRSALAVLVATNFLGHNAAAIAATEAVYGEMWVQDATAMYGYAASSASAGVLQPLSTPVPNTNAAGLAGQAAAVGSSQAGLSQLVAGLPEAMQTLASPLAAAAPSTQAGMGGFVSDFINSIQNIGIWNGIQTYSTYLVSAGVWHLFAGIASAIAIAAEGGTTGLGGSFLMGAVAPAGAAGAAGLVGSGGAPVLASAGQASSVGGLSVPASWSAVAPAETGSATLASAGWTAAVEESTPVTAVPAGMGSVASAGRGGFGFGAPRYGFKPTVMPRPVVAG